MFLSVFALYSYDSIFRQSAIEGRALFWLMVLDTQDPSNMELAVVWDLFGLYHAMTGACGHFCISVPLIEGFHIPMISSILMT